MLCLFQTGYPGKPFPCFHSLGRSEQGLGHPSCRKVSTKSHGEEFAKEKLCVSKSGEWNKKRETDAKVQGTEELGSEVRSQEDGQTSLDCSKVWGAGGILPLDLPRMK